MSAPLEVLISKWPASLVPAAPGRLVVPPALRAVTLAGMAQHLDRPLLAVVPGERVAEELFVKEGSPKSVYSFIQDAHEAGAKFYAMLETGQSEPWQDTLEKLTGTRQMDASAIIDYFQPLMGYLQEQNEGLSCGW